MAYVKNFFILIGLFLLSQVSMTVFQVAKMMSMQSGAQQLSLGMTLVTLLVIIGNCWLLIFIGKKLGFVTFRWDFLTKTNTWLIIGGFILARVIAIVGTLLLNIQGKASTNNDETIQLLFKGENPLLIILLIGVSAPIMEEIVFRGGIIGLWLKKFPMLGIAVSSICFGLVHGPTDVISFLIYGSMGLILAYAYYKTQRIEVSMSIHFLNNILPAIILALGYVS